MPSPSASLAGATARVLRRWNLAMAGLHLAQALLMLSLSSDFAVPVTASFVHFDPASGGLEPEPRVLFELRLAPVIASFLLISAAAHLAVSLPRVHGWYLRNLGLGVNYARWAEYALSASVMIVAIAMLTGIYDIVSLVVLFALNASMILFGWLMERHNRATANTDWTAYVFGCLAGVVPWVAVGVYLVGAGDGEGGVPGFVYAIYVSIFAAFNIFAVNMFLQYRRLGPWRDYLFGERVYILLSLGAKTLLAWQVYAGTLQPN